MSEVPLYTHDPSHLTLQRNQQQMMTTDPCNLVRKRVFFCEICVLVENGFNDHANYKIENVLVKQN